MLKISEIGTLNRDTTFKLEGRIVGPWVAELRRSCELLLSREKSVTLDLSEVSFVDADGVAELNALKSGGVALANCTPFVEQQIKTFA
jgi:hypothetical protein